MIHGIGTDLCSIERIREIFAKFDLKFAKRILSNVEFSAFLTVFNEKTQQNWQKNCPDSKDECANANNSSHYFESKTSFKIKSLENFLAKRFAAKEAFSKALGVGIGRGINFCDIEIGNDQFGKPIISFPGKKEEFLKQVVMTKNYQIFLSLSDEKKPIEAVLAMVVIEKF